MNISIAGNTSLANYCLEKLCRAGYSVVAVLLPRKGFIESSDIVDSSSLAGEFDIRKITLPIKGDFKDDTQTDILIKLEWPEDLSIPVQPTLTTVGCNLSGQYRQGRLLDVAADIYKGKSQTEIQLFSEASQGSSGYKRENIINKTDKKVLGYSQVEINIFDDVRSMKTKAAVTFSRLLSELLDHSFSSGVMPDPSARKYIFSSASVNRWIDWRQDVTKIYNLVRSFTHPGPGAFTLFDDKRLYVWRGHFFDFSDNLYASPIPGTVLDVIEELGMVVKAGDGVFLITRIQPAGAPVLPAWVWADESHIKSGDRLKTFVEEPEKILS